MLFGFFLHFTTMASLGTELVEPPSGMNPDAILSTKTVAEDAIVVSG
jgi:hypothetical protein